MDFERIEAGSTLTRYWVYGAMCLAIAAGVIAQISLRTVDTSHGGPGGNKNAAIVTLKNLHAAQARFQAACYIDTDGNNIGEYGYFAELAGKLQVRARRGSSGKQSSPPLLSSTFAKVQSRPGVAGGLVIHDGYIFQIFLPNANGEGIPEAAGGGTDIESKPDTSRSESLWCCYAWPVRRDRFGRDALFINQAGDVLTTEPDPEGYQGLERVPSYDAAFLNGSRRRMSSTIAFNDVGNDGLAWIVVR